ncbi:MAG: hypothetical protein AB7O28_08840 [Vicinamibacterales bacterium]
MGPSAVHFIPIVTTVLAVPFSLEIFRRYRQFPDRLHLLWWAIGIATYGIGTFTEATTTLLGWNPVVFRAWYISGALLGGAPLAQGTVYLMLGRKAAHALTTLLIVYVIAASVAVCLSPIDYSAVETYRLSGRVFEWQWVRLFSPIVNIYAVIFLIGGAILSAVKYSSDPATRHRMWANVLIAVGALLPGIGGTATRMGHVEVLYVTELIGMLMTWSGYRISVRPASGTARPAPAGERAPA